MTLEALLSHMKTPEFYFDVWINQRRASSEQKDLMVPVGSAAIWDSSLYLKACFEECISTVYNKLRRSMVHLISGFQNSASLFFFFRYHWFLMSWSIPLVNKMDCKDCWKYMLTQITSLHCMIRATFMWTSNPCKCVTSGNTTEQLCGPDQHM